MKNNKWMRLLAYVTGLVNRELLLQNEYLAAENRILRAHLPNRLRLTILKGRLLLKSEKGSVEKPCSRSRLRLNRKRSSRGIDV